MNSLHRVTCIAFIALSCCGLIYIASMAIAFWVSPNRMAGHAEIFFYVLKITGWVVKGCLSVVILDFSVSTLIVPREGIRFLKRSDFEKPKTSPEECEQALNDYMSNLPAASLLYMRIIGAAVLLLAITLVTIGN
jgi:hypothetical protein